MHDHIRIACVRGTAFEVESWVASCCAQEEGHLRDDDAVSKPDPEIESLSILEALPNQLLLPNGEAAASDHDRFRLSDGELGFVRRPIPGQRMVLSRKPRSSTVLNAVLKALGRFWRPLVVVKPG